MNYSKLENYNFLDFTFQSIYAGTVYIMCNAVFPNNSENIEKESNFLQYGTDYKKNHSKLIEELDREGFIYNASFYEEIETYVLNKENEILTGYQKLNGNDQNYQMFLQIIYFFHHLTYFLKLF